MTCDEWLVNRCSRAASTTSVGRRPEKAGVKFTKALEGGAGPTKIAIHVCQPT